MTRAVYLHGFASSPRSSKAQFFSSKLTGCGAAVDVPALDAGDFQAMTIASQLQVVGESVGQGPVTLFGSSLGGYLAALYAARHPEAVERLVLLAPAFQFPSRWRQRYTPQDLETWRRNGVAPIFHYGENREVSLGYGFMEDSLRFEEEPDVHQPTLIFHGTRDQVVPAEVSQRFAGTRPNVQLQLMESGHELTDVLDPMWDLTSQFLNHQVLNHL